MTVATGAPVAITKLLPAGVVTTYNSTSTSLYVTNAGVTKIYNAIVDNSSLTHVGSVTTTGVVFATEGTYMVEFKVESAADMDTNAITVNSLGSIGCVTVSTLVTTVSI